MTETKSLDGRESWEALGVGPPREGDVFRWRLRDHIREPWGTDPYWCCSCIAIVKQGRLWDTYWGIAGSDRKSFATDDASLELSFLGNINDFDLRPIYDRGYYADKDIMDLRHPNDRSAFYVRKGASRNREAMIAEAERRLQAAERDAAIANSKAETARNLIATLKSGSDLSSVWI